MTRSVGSIRSRVVAPIATVLLTAVAANAQLLSPGELTTAHASLEGVARCTSCHTIGGKGVDETKCLDCHQPIRSRLKAGTGLHSTFDDPCVACHKEHLGRNFSLVRFDSASFDHSRTGFDLIGAHAQTNCSSCHREDLIVDADLLAARERAVRAGRTYLGLDTGCISCHAASAPHESQFAGRECSECHTTERWVETTPFSHAGSAFQLSGRHTDVACSQCHPASTSPNGQTRTQYVDIPHTECTSCHSDPHQKAFGTACGSCHSPAGWSQITQERLFSHERTGYALVGAHARLSCRSCHGQPARNDDAIQITFAESRRSKSYPSIVASGCLSCHVDYHGGSFREESAGGSCDACHTPDRWLPTTFDIERHNQVSRFELTGAHLSVQCVSCHRKDDAKAAFVFSQRRCDSCHLTNNPHGSQFDGRMLDNSCASCHTTTAWNSDIDFDHSSTDFALLGVHASTSCTSCHVQAGEISTRSGIDYTGLKSACSSCHASADPHRGQFDGRDCDACHDAAGFVPVSARFDHDQSAFALSGAHAKIACGVCHEKSSAPDGSSFTLYRIRKNQCVDCHTSE